MFSSKDIFFRTAKRRVKIICSDPVGGVRTRGRFLRVPGGGWKEIRFYFLLQNVGVAINGMTEREKNVTSFGALLFEFVRVTSALCP